MIWGQVYYTFSVEGNKQKTKIPYVLYLNNIHDIYTAKYRKSLESHTAE